MPTYEYACGLCGHKMEVFQSIVAERLVSCPACSKEGLRRLIGTGAGLIFKGTGFYQTDYKNSPPPKGESGSDGAKESGTPVAGDKSSSAAAPASAGANSSTPAADGGKSSK